jgi:hypothetical protein
MNWIVPAVSAVAVFLFISSFAFRPALAHEVLEQGDIKIVGGWVNEPPLVGQFNGIELTVTRISDGQPIANANSGLDISIKKGTLTRTLDVVPTEELGLYVADIIPTQVGQYAVVFKGTVAGQAIDGQIEIEDVEDTSRFEFPPASGDDNNPDTVIVEQLREIIAELTSEVDRATTASDEAKEAAQAATESAAELKVSADRAYLFGMVGVGVGVAGVVIGVFAVSRIREKS